MQAALSQRLVSDMTKEDAISLIRDLAARNGDKVSLRSFIEESGIPEYRLRRELWFSGWNLLLQEIGLTTNEFFIDKTSDDDVASSVAKLIVRLQHWPTEDEFFKEKKANPTFPGVSVIRRAKKSGKLRALLERDLTDNETSAITRAIVKRLPVANEDQTDDNDTSVRVQGFVYMMRAGQRYKIGKTNSPVRRYREIQLELPDELIKVHTIETDDPTGIEAYWHKRFDEKRIRNSEWFELDANDVRAFKRRKYQ